MKKSIWNKAALILSAFLAAGVMTIFKACGPKEDGTYMHCHSVQMYIFYIALAEIVIIAATLFIRNTKAIAALMVCGAVLSLIAVLLPGRIMPMCMMDTMRCHALMKPAVTILGVIITIADCMGAISAVRIRA